MTLTAADWSVVLLGAVLTVTGIVLLVRPTTRRGGYVPVLIGAPMLVSKIAHMAGWPHPVLIATDLAGLASAVAAFAVSLVALSRARRTQDPAAAGTVDPAGHEGGAGRAD